MAPGFQLCCLNFIDVFQVISWFEQPGSCWRADAIGAKRLGKKIDFLFPLIKELFFIVFPCKVRVKIWQWSFLSMQMFLIGGTNIQHLRYLNGWKKVGWWMVWILSNHSKSKQKPFVFKWKWPPSWIYYWKSKLQKITFHPHKKSLIVLPFQLNLNKSYSRMKDMFSWAILSPCEQSE